MKTYTGVGQQYPTDRCTEPPAGVAPDGAAACAGHRRHTAAWGGALGACAPGRSAAARLSRSAVRADPAAAGALGAPASASGHRAWAETCWHTAPASPDGD